MRSFPLPFRSSVRSRLPISARAPRSRTRPACSSSGYAAQYVPTESIKDIFREVERGRADFGVVPIENSTEGVVNYTLDMFIDSDLKIYAEIMIEVSQNLMNKSGRIEDIKKIYTHPQVPGQCRLWLEKNLPGVPIMDAPSTARAAEMAAQDPSIGAIASEMASMLYGLQMVARRIEDNQNNYTRFLVIAVKSPGKTGRDKTSIMFSIKDRVGALYEMLAPFAAHEINLNRLDARPSGRKVWDYVFFLDMEGHIEDEKVAAAIERLRVGLHVPESPGVVSTVSVIQLWISDCELKKTSNSQSAIHIPQLK